MGVKILQIFFGIILVASNRPPNPVSKIRKSDFDCLNKMKAAAVVISKKVIGSLLFIFFTNLEFCKVPLCLLPYYLELFFH